MSAGECAILALIHDQLRPPSILTNWTNVVPAAGFAKGACCTWKGVHCDQSSETVTSIYLGREGLSGTLPSAIASLTELRVLNMFQNQMTGSIPAEIVSLQRLQNLALGINNFTGTIPDNIGLLTSLTQLAIDKNQISGTLPSAIGNLRSLTVLNVGVNKLTGTLPSEIQNLVSLEWLNVGVNSFSGTIPPGINSCKPMKTLYLWKNRFTGEIPPQVFELTNLELLTLDTNSFVGALPTNIGNLQSLRELDLRSNSFTSLPPQITDLSLKECRIDSNPFTCLPKLPPACSTSVFTASKCPAPTGNVEMDPGAVSSDQLIAIIVSVIGVAALLIGGMFFVRRRRLLRAGKERFIAGNRETDKSSSNPDINSSDPLATYIEPFNQPVSETVIQSHIPCSSVDQPANSPNPALLASGGLGTNNNEVLILSSQPYLPSGSRNLTLSTNEAEVLILSQNLQQKLV